jgi:hypothetical protein
LLTKGVHVSGCRSSFLDVNKRLANLFSLPPSALRKQGVAYLLVHFLANTSTFIIASFFYDYFFLHAAWIVLLLVIATYLGGQYYEVRRTGQAKLTNHNRAATRFLGGVHGAPSPQPPWSLSPLQSLI